MSVFSDALISRFPKKDYENKLNLFGQFVGEWDFDWIWIGDGSREDANKVKGEWIFSWVLDGTAIQDVWICPSREETLKHEHLHTEYGTTIRFYNPNEDAWNVVYGCSDYMTVLKARQENSNIVLEAQNIVGYKMKWVFSDITADSFTWRNMRSDDNGATWRTEGEMQAVRKM
jgi:hypothetical protein